MSYQHLTGEQRAALAALKRLGHTQQEIADQVGISQSAISRELSRNRTRNKNNYDARVAQRKTKQRRVKANQRFRKLVRNNPQLRQYVIRKIKRYWSPDQIAGRINRGRKKKLISHQAIYDFIYQERPDLKKYLRCQKGKWRRRYGTKKREKAREEAKKKRIDTRPKAVDKRSRVGDWEGDTMEGMRGTGSILTHVDRKSGKLKADKLDAGTAAEVRQKTNIRFQSDSRQKKHTITYDNGSSFASHELMEKDTGMSIYFAYPYHAWERGCNENCNGLLRQFFPKKTSFENVTQNEVDRAERLLNTRPRKRLNYRTPNEVFYQR